MSFGCHTRCQVVYKYEGRRGDELSLEVGDLVEDVVRPLVEDFRVNALQVEGQADWEAVIGVGDFALDQRFVVGQVVSPNVDDTVICNETNKILLLVRDYYVMILARITKYTVWKKYSTGNFNLRKCALCIDFITT